MQLIWTLEELAEYGQPIKLIQVVSASEFHEYWLNDIFFVPSVFCRASEASNIDCFKT